MQYKCIYMYIYMLCLRANTSSSAGWNITSIWREMLLFSEAIIVMFRGSPEMICFKGPFFPKYLPMPWSKRFPIELGWPWSHCSLMSQDAPPPQCESPPAVHTGAHPHARAHEQCWWALAAFLILSKLKQTGIWWDVFLKQGCPNF